MSLARVSLFLGWTLAGLSHVTAENFTFEDAGVRSGFSATRINEHFYQVEAYTRLNAPAICHLELGRRLKVRTGLELSMGVLGRDNTQGFVGTLGPVFTLGREGCPIELFAGTAGTYLTREQFNRVHFGIPFQFTSHLGLSLQMGRHWRASYRLQHMSNASIHPRNPGLDLHALAFSYVF
jgi:hypothetical protein